MEVLEEVMRITNGNTEAGPKLDVCIDSDIIPLNGMRIDGGDRSGHDIMLGTYRDLMPTLLHVNGANIQKLVLSPLIDMHIPNGFLQILSSALNLEYLSVGYRVAFTYVSFDEIADFVKVHPRLITLLIPWIMPIKWEKKSDETTNDLDETETNETETLIHGKDDTIEEKDKWPRLEVLGFPCFGLKKSQLFILEDIKATIPTLKELVALSCLSESWEDGNDWRPDLEL